jgi:very-short-patch-repair endonuclease
VNCVECADEIVTSAVTTFKDPKTNQLFCSKRCFVIYDRKQKKKRRSKPEVQLAEYILQWFPTLVVDKNNRTVIPGKLEIDILIEELKLAIEINGPTHYAPIFGATRLETTQKRDAIKTDYLLNNGYTLCVLDSSKENSAKKQEEFIKKAFDEQVKPLIQQLFKS